MELSSLRILSTGHEHCAWPWDPTKQMWLQRFLAHGWSTEKSKQNNVTTNFSVKNVNCMPITFLFAQRAEKLWRQCAVGHFKNRALPESRDIKVLLIVSIFFPKYVHFLWEIVFFKLHIEGFNSTMTSQITIKCTDQSQSISFLNSWIIYQIYTNKITTVKEVWIPGLN